jgi:hypothetical protein
MKESAKSVIEIEEDDEDLLTSLLKSLYTQEIGIESKKDIVSLLMLAEKYMLNNCAQRIAECLAQNISHANALQCLELDLDKYANVKESFSSYCVKNANIMLQGTSFLALDAGQISLLLSIIVNKTNGMKGIEVMTRWVEHNVEERSENTFSITKVVQTAAKRSKAHYNVSTKWNLEDLHWSSDESTKRSRSYHKDYASSDIDSHFYDEY